MQYNVHVKNELGRDDNIVVDAESEIAAERAAAQHGSVADVIGAYPAVHGPYASPERVDEAMRSALADQGITVEQRSAPLARHASEGGDTYVAVSRAREALAHLREDQAGELSWRSAAGDHFDAKGLGR